ncbi:MAG: PKD domain-containing protein [Bacteroidia bacterium]
MKYCFRSICLLFLTSSSLFSYGQTLTVNPTPICEGDQAFFTFVYSPTKTIAYYKFWFDQTALVMPIAMTTGASASNTFSWIGSPAGNWTGKALLVYTDSSTVGPVTTPYTVYYKPIAKFYLTSFSKDTQCFKGNNFCFIDSSRQNPKTPSAPLSTCYWIFGDGGSRQNCSPIVCMSYSISNTKYNVDLTIADNVGCVSHVRNPVGYDSVGIYLAGNINPQFNWTYVSGPCFASTYKFKNTSAINKTKVQSYKWDFGDGATYTATVPFNTLQSSHFDTISHTYTQDGQFMPSLIITDIYGCTDTIKYTNANIPVSVTLPRNISFKINLTASTSYTDTINRDSFCAGSNLARVYFSQKPISFAQLGNGDIVWDFGDPNDPYNLNKDSFSWTPSHLYSGVGKYIVRFTVKNVCKDTSVSDTIEVLGPLARIENISNGSAVSMLHKYQCTGNDTVDFVNNSSYYKSNHVKRVWDFDDNFAPVCTAYSVPKSPAMVTFTNAQQQYYNSNHFYISNGTTYTGRMNCRYSLDSLPRHIYTNWDSVYSWYQNGKTFPAGSNTPNISANTSITITAANPVPDPFWQAQGRMLNLTSGTLRNKFDSITYTIPGFGTFTRYGNQLLPNSGITFHEYVFRYVVIRAFTISQTLTDSFNHASGNPAACSSVDYVKLSHGKPDAHGMSVIGKQCPGLNPTGYIGFKLKANGSAAGTKPSCGQTSIYINFDSLADRMDATPFYLDGFTTWGVGTPGTQIVPGPGFNITPGGLVRNTFYTGMNWNPIPPSPWSGPDGTFIQYHYGGNAGTPPPADTAQGFVTIGLFLGSGQKDSTFTIWKSNFNNNQNNNGTPLRDYLGRLINPSTGYPYTYQNVIIGRNVANRATPPPTPIPTGWRDDSIALTYTWNGIINSTPLIRSAGPPIVYDTLLTLQYLDYNNPRCVSDTVWYHNFLHIKELNPTMIKSPAEFAVLREKNDTVKAIHMDQVQDSIFVNVWTWGDNTATIDSFHYAGYDVTDSYYTHGARRIRYNMDYTTGWPGTLIDSTLWPCGVFGQKQYLQPIRSYLRMFDQVGTKAPDSLILVNKFPSTTHFDQWYPYTNYHDTIHLRMRDTMLYTTVKIIDTSLMLLPVTHQYKRSSWEIAGKGPGAIITQFTNFLQNSQQCTYFFGQTSTIGLIDSLHIFSKNGKEDSVFCKSDPVRFVDSVRYFRYDNQITNIVLQIYGTSRPGGYHGFQYNTFPESGYQFDTIDFWARDAKNPADTLVEVPNAGSNVVFYDYNGGSIDLTNYMIDFVYFNEGQRNYDVDLFQNTIVVDTPGLGHWDFVLKGGGVSVVVPNFSSDKATMNPFVGKVIFYPTTGNLGSPGIYVWSGSAWVPSFAPINIDTLNSLTDISKTPSPAVGKTLIYNKGKGNYKRTGMYYWSGAQWIFICNSPYTSFPYFTHRLYWDFGDGTPVYQGVRPTHNYNTGGKFKVSMISRDSLGHFDTCVSFVNVTDMVAKPTMASSILGCKDTASFIDSSYTLSGGIITNHYWWFYNNAKDTVTVQSNLANPVVYYNHNGKFKVKLISTSDRGCSATGYLTFFKQGPRPAFRLLSGNSGCRPRTVVLKNLADSLDKRNAADTPTICTAFDWADGQQTYVYGRTDTVSHVYVDTGIFFITAAGRDAPQFYSVNCPVVYFPDTAGGQNGILVVVKGYRNLKISGNANPHINDTATYYIANDSIGTFNWNVQSGTVLSGTGTYAIIVKWATATGVYKVTAGKTNSMGCYVTDTMMVHVLVQAVKDLTFVNGIKLFPNPANNEVTISMNSQKSQDLNIKIYDMLGRVCTVDQIKSANGFVSKNISLSQLSKGIYFVEISAGDEKTVTKLLIE